MRFRMRHIDGPTLARIQHLCRKPCAVSLARDSVSARKPPSQAGTWLSWRPVRAQASVGVEGLLGRGAAQPARSRSATSPGLHRRRQRGAAGSAGQGLLGGAPAAMLESSPPEFEGQAAQATAGDGQLADLRGLPGATRQECKSRRDALADWLRTENRPAAAETLRRDWDDFVTFYDFPTEHWLHLRTSNPIESVFAGVRLRTDVAKRARNRDNALHSSRSCSGWAETGALSTAGPASCSSSSPAPSPCESGCRSWLNF